jgi:uncharacterized protein (DUF433 family)
MKSGKEVIMEKSIHIRNTGLTIIDLLDALAFGHSYGQVLNKHKDLTMADILSSLQFARDILNDHVNIDGDVIINGRIQLRFTNTRFINLTKLRETHPRAFEPWSKKEEQTLTELHQQRHTIAQICEVLGRQEGAIVSRLKKLGLIEKTPQPPEPPAT